MGQVERGLIAGGELVQGDFDLPEEEKIPVFFEEKKFDLHGVNVNFLGVTHAPITLKVHGLEIEEKISESDAVILELLPFEFSRDEEDWTELFIPKGLEFFNDVLDTSKENNVSVVGVDPLTPSLEAFVYMLMFTSMSTTAGITIASLYEILEKREVRISRRRFLALLGGAAATASITYNESRLSRFFRGGLRGKQELHNELSTYGVDDQLGVDTYNYRNIRIAQAVRKLCRDHSRQLGLKELTMIFGYYHQNPIIEYIQNEHRVEEALKAVPYEVYDLFGNDGLRWYDLDSQGNWAKRLEIG